MSKVAVVYWSGTGNTKAMAEAIHEAATQAGAASQIFECSEFSPDKVKDFDKLAFGCPAMGAEELEDTEFEPLFTECESQLKDKPFAIFGSYSWAEGEWMEKWEERCRDNGLKLSYDSLIAYDYPDAEALEACKKLGQALAQ